MSTLAKQTHRPSLRSLMEDFRDTDHFFNNDFFKGGLPAVNVVEKEKHFQVEVAAPGFKKEDFMVDIDNGVLTISAETRKEERDDDEHYTRREFSSASFMRSFKLPENVKENGGEATYEHGLLKITLAKNNNKKPAKKGIKTS